ncbi:hypothetical protein SDC9_145082 [bioreactor metagenome]|uniref:Uncharacterized protein n=1 Tax=bioreactor metagenome TaxID=1076179 RepID=A0A645EB69_9ZZZZ
MIAVGANGFWAGRVDDDRSIHACELLHAGVRVVPIGAALLDLEAIGEGLTGGNPVEADAWHTIHLIRKNDAVPVDGGGFAKLIGHSDRDGFTFAPTQCRRG